MSKLHCIVLTGGGTGGHVTPNLALIPYLAEDWDKVVYWVLLSVCLLGNLVALNTYKLMVLQMRVTTLTALVTLGFAIVLGIDWLRLGSEQLTFSYNIIFPAVCTVLDVLALRGILHDQLMVEAAGRLRNHYRSKGRK